jgi:hypothetical protein
MRAPRKLVAPVLLIGLLAAACTGTTNSGGTPDVYTSPPPNIDTTMVLIVDDFGRPTDGSVVVEDNAKPDKAVKADERKKHNCAYAGVPSNDVESYGATTSSPPPTTSHGEMVASVLINELATRQPGTSPASVTPYGSPSTGYTGDAQRWFNPAANRELVVQKISVKRYKVEQLIQRIDRALKETGFEHIIFNFSFIVAPCDIGAWFENSEDADALLKLYNDKFGTSLKLGDLEQVISGLEQPVERWTKQQGDFLRFMAGADHQPLRAQLANDRDWSGFRATHTPTGTPSVVAVGAAGNGIAYNDGSTIRTVRLPVPFIPAGWPGVLSVSATDGLTTYSNDAEYQFDGTMNYGGVPWKGTSFASPRLAADLALFQYTDGAPPTCAAGLDYNDLVQWTTTHLFQNKTLTQPTPSQCPHT